MNNEPVAWMLVDKSWNDFCRYSSYPSEGAIPLYTHPAKTLTDDAARYQWLRNEFANGRETYIGESMPSGEKLDEYIDEQLRKAQENGNDTRSEG